MKVLPPGNILQNLYLKRRLKKLKASSFLEVGSGNGYISNVLLKAGLKGVGCDLNVGACANNSTLNKRFISNESYKVFNDDFVNCNLGKFDIIISSMVIEHIPDDELHFFLVKMKKHLTENGTMIFFVPASMRHWGIEDEIAGHIKRYEYEDFHILGEKLDMKNNHSAGLTYPLSNWLYSLSNKIIAKKEKDKMNLSKKERTVYTGNRNVPYKTSFPKWFIIILNEVVMYPFYILQLIFRSNRNCLVIYCELIK